MIVSKNVLISIYSKLNTTSAVTTLVTGIFNEVTQNQAYPYVAITESDLLETKWNTFGKKGKEVRVFIHIYSIAKTDMEVLTIAEAIDTALDWNSLTITSSNHIVTAFEKMELITEEEESQQIKAKHAILEYKILTTES
jgi:hypothetical protein